MNMVKKTLVASAIAAAVSTSALAFEGINFDPTGSGSGLFTNEWVWQYTSMLVDDGIQKGNDDYSGQSATLLVQGQGKQANCQGCGGQVFDTATMDDFSFILSVPVLIERKGDTPDDPSSIGSSISWTLDTTADTYGSSNYFELYHNPTGPDTDTGADFDGGTKILEGKVEVNADLLNKLELVNIPSPLPNLGPTATADTWRFSGNLNLIVDVCDASEVATGSGDAACEGGAVSAFDADFFPNTEFISDFTYDMNLGGQPTDPFDSDNPVPDKVVNVTPNFDNRTVSDTNTADAINSLKCELKGGSEDLCDVIASLSSDGTPTSSWVATAVPEPATLALLGVGLAAMGLRNRKRRNS